MWQVDGLVVRENELNTELEQTRNEYETQIREQNRELLSLRAHMQEPSDAELSLKEQVHNLLQHLSVDKDIVT